MFRQIGIGALAMLAACITGASAQDWPTKPVTIIVLFAPGGANDVMARILVPHLSETLGQQVIIENVPGAGGRVGMSRVVKSAPDGYVLGMGSSPTQIYSQLLFKNPPYDVANDFEPVAMIAAQPLVLATRRDLPPNNLKEFIAYSKENATKLQYGSAGVGSATHLACVLLNHAAGLNIIHVPYKGGAPLTTDLLAGRIDYWCGISTTVMPHIQNDKIKAIALLAPERLSILPDLPTAHEQGLTDLDASTWNALFAPKGTPAVIVKRLSDAVSEVLDTPAVRKRLAQLGATVTPPGQRSPEFLAKFIQEDLKRWAPPIKAAGVSLD